MNKRLNIEIKKGPLNPEDRMDLLQVYKASKEGEKVYYKERLLDYPYYVRIWDADQLVGFRGLELSQTENGGKPQLVVELGEAFILSTYRSEDIFKHLALKIYISLKKEQLLNFWQQAKKAFPKSRLPLVLRQLLLPCHTSGCNIQKTISDDWQASPRQGVEMLFLSKKRRDTSIHYYGETKSTLGGINTIKKANFSIDTAIELFLASIQAFTQRLSLPQLPAINSANLKPKLPANYLQFD